MEGGNDGWVIAIVFMAMGGFVFLLGFVKMRKYRVIKDTPRSKIRSMAMGIVEIHGHAKADKLIKSPFSKSDCVYYKYEIKEYRKSSSSSSKSSSYRWETVNWGDKRIPFYAEDETGEVLVEPKGAEVNVSYKKAFYQRHKGLIAGFAGLRNIIKALKNFDPNNPESLLDIEGLDLEPMENRTGFTATKVGDRKYLEYYIEPGDTLFVLGTAANSPDAPSNVLIRKGTNEKTFIIADKKEVGVLKSLKKMMIVCFVFGGIFFGVGVIVLLQMLGVIKQY